MDSLLEESFLGEDDELLLELRKQAEALGLDAEVIVAAAKRSETATMRRVDAPGPFAVNPQRARKEARRRLNESVQRTARVLLNRVGLEPGGVELSRRFFGGLTGANFVAATQLLHRGVQKTLGIKAGELGKLDTPDYEKGIGLLPDLLEQEVRRIKVKQRQVVEAAEDNKLADASHEDPSPHATQQLVDDGSCRRHDRASRSSSRSDEPDEARSATGRP